ncbi:MAG: transcriptional regulator, ArsR family [Oscillospiraceae bacterium]|jgi:ArsR family transcriptional regulator|nr:transcriptional regulator, ArsR family [Oscillospiraceae bacterium]
MPNNHKENAKIFKAFCDETRLMVLSLLQSGEKCACVLLEQVNVGQPTLSHHMRILVDSGVVSARKQGKWTHYSISKSGSAKAKELLDLLTTVNESENEIGCCNE